MRTGIFIEDDHFMVIEGIRSLLQNEKEIDRMGHYNNAASCLDFLKRHQPDVIVPKIILFPATPIVFLS